MRGLHKAVHVAQEMGARLGKCKILFRAVSARRRRREGLEGNWLAVPGKQPAAIGAGQPIDDVKQTGGAMICCK